MCPKSRVEDLTPENEWAYEKYVACKTLGGLPRAGGLADQDRMLMKKFEVLAMMDRHMERAIERARIF
jgi:hypothetical protein